MIASAPFPGQGQRLSARLVLGKPGSLPLDRYLALPVVAAVAGLLFFLAASEMRRWFRPACNQDPASDSQPRAVQI